MIVEGASLPDDVFEESADVVIVGSGAGGAVVAAHLAEAGQRVVVLEEGPHVPASRYSRMRPSESLRHLWRDGGLTMAVGLGDTPMINVMMGECIGGSSVLTGAVCFRAPDSVLAEWSGPLRLRELSPGGMTPYFDDVERASSVETVPVAMRSRSTELFGIGAARLGHPLSALRRNTKDCRGCGRCNFGCPEGAKQSVDLTYLLRAERAGARIFSDVRVDRILTKGSRAVGVTGSLRNGANRKPRGKLTLHARRVVVAAGAYCTPLILERTGLGVASEQLGRNLTLHPGFRMMARFDEPVLGWKGALQSAFSHAYEAERINLVGLFVPPGVLAATLSGIADSHLAELIPHLAVFGGMVHDDPGGRVHHLLGRRAISYRMSARDSAATSRALSLLAETFFAAGAREVQAPILGVGLMDADRFRALDLDRVPRRNLECTSQHPLGTCRMGSTAEHSVVDPDGQTWELEELYVADGSIVPTSLGVNPQETIMAMATRIAWKLREQPRARTSCVR